MLFQEEGVEGRGKPFASDGPFGMQDLVPAGLPHSFGIRVGVSVQVDGDEPIHLSPIADAAAFSEGDELVVRASHHDLMPLLLQLHLEHQGHSQGDVLLVRSMKHCSRVLSSVPGIDANNHLSSFKPGKPRARRIA
jgi:hypothetical protein